MNAIKRKLIQDAQVNSMIFNKNKVDKFKSVFSYIENDGYNQFFRSISDFSHEEMIYNCFGYKSGVSGDGEMYFKLLINPVMNNELINNDIFKFSKSSINIINAGSRRVVFNVVEFKMDCLDMIFEGSCDIECAILYLNKYLKEVSENIKNNSKHYEIDYDNLFNDYNPQINTWI